MIEQSKIAKRIAGLEKWLTEQGVDVKKEQKHLDAGSVERLYWHYGYLIALKDVLGTSLGHAAARRTSCCGLLRPAEMDAGKGCDDCPERKLQ